MTSISIYLNSIRQTANSSKYVSWYVNIISSAKLRASTKQIANELLGYTEAHHILPKCFKMGGEDDIENLVYLTPREHFICHWLLTKMFDVKRQHAQMSKALTRFLQCNDKQERALTSHQYDAIRRVWHTSSKDITPYKHSPETLLKMRKPRSEAARQKMRKPKSDEHCANISKSKNNQFSSAPTQSCVHCGKVMDIGNLKRYHNERCKTQVS